MVNWYSWDHGKVILTVWETPRVRPRTTWGPSPPSSAASPRTEWARWEVYLTVTSRLSLWSRLSLGRRDCSAIQWTLDLTSFIIILISMISKVIMFMKLLVIVRILKIQLYEIQFVYWAYLVTIHHSHLEMIILQPRPHGFIFFFIKWTKLCREKVEQVEHNEFDILFLENEMSVVAKNICPCWAATSWSLECASQPGAQRDDTRGVISILLCLIYWSVQVSLRQHDPKYFSTLK